MRFHHPLFTLKDPDKHPNGFLAAVDPHSEETFPNAVVEVGLDEVTRRAPWPAAAGESGEAHGPESVRFQGLRKAYYCVDPDSAGDEVVLNRIVSLKEDAGKRA